jgi:hypothetical protein
MQEATQDMGIDAESRNPKLCSEVADGITRRVDSACVFSESRMQEICQSGSMSGKRKQNHAKPDCGGQVKI